MKDRRVRMTVEFSIDDEALQEHGVSAEEVLKHLVFVEDDVADGFRISTDIPGMSPVSNFFLCEGRVISQGFVPAFVKDDGLDRWRRMVIDAIDVADLTIGLESDEKDALVDSHVVIDWLAKRMDLYMQNGDRNEYDSLELVFDEYFEDMVETLREHGMEYLENVFQMIDGLGISREAKLRGEILFIEDVEIFLADDGEMMCLVPDVDEPAVMRGDIRDIESGDAFFRLNTGMVCFAQEDAHQNFDEPDEPWIVSDDSWGGFFEEDIGKELYSKVSELLLYVASAKENTLSETLAAAEAKADKTSKHRETIGLDL